MKTRILLLPALFFAMTCFYLLTLTSSCLNSPSSTGDEVILPDSLQSANDFLQYGIAQLYQTWDFPAAEKALKTALDMDSSMVGAHAQYAWYLYLMKQNGKAIDHIHKAWKLAPNNLMYQTWYAWICMLAGDYDLADRHLDSVISVDSTFIGAYNIKAQGLIEKGQYELAIEALEKASAHPRYYHVLAVARARSGDKDSARQILNNLKQNDDLTDQLSFAAIHLALDEKEQAYQALEQARDNRHVYFPFATVTPAYMELWEEERFNELFAGLDLPTNQ